MSVGIQGSQARREPGPIAARGTVSSTVAQRDREQVDRERPDEVHDAREDRVDRAAEEAGDEAEQQRDEAADQRASRRRSRATRARRTGRAPSRRGPGCRRRGSSSSASRADRLLAEPERPPPGWMTSTSCRRRRSCRSRWRRTGRCARCGWRRAAPQAEHDDQHEQRQRGSATGCARSRARRGAHGLRDLARRPPGASATPAALGSKANSGMRCAASLALTEPGRS